MTKESSLNCTTFDDEKIINSTEIDVATENPDDNKSIIQAYINLPCNNDKYEIEIEPVDKLHLDILEISQILHEFHQYIMQM